MGFKFFFSFWTGKIVKLRDLKLIQDPTGKKKKRSEVRQGSLAVSALERQRQVEPQAW